MDCQCSSPANGFPARVPVTRLVLRMLFPVLYGLVRYRFRDE